MADPALSSEPLRRVWHLELAGIVPIVLAGAVLHFAFDWAGGWRPLALVAAVNEAVWEHLKMAFWPGFAWALLVQRLARPPATTFWLAKALGLLVVPVTISALYFAYKAVHPANILALDIAIFALAIAAGQFSSPLLFGRLMRRSPMRRKASAAGSLMALQLAAYSLCTYYPPPLALFTEEHTGRSGVPSASAPLDAHG